jgi:Protein of unknown function (DUF4012)
MRRLALATVVAVAGGVLFVALMLPSALSARRALEAGRVDLVDGKKALEQGHLPEAIERLRAASSSFRSASEAARSAPLRVLSVLPIAGRTVDTVVALSDGGGQLADASLIVVRALETVGGIDGLASVGGRIPVERIQPLADALARAAPMVDTARVEISGSPKGLVLGSVVGARRLALEQIAAAATTFDAGRTILGGLPAFLGDDGPKTYFVGAENPAELRGTGGLIGAYALLTFDDGRFSMSPFRPVARLPNLDPTVVQAPSAEYARLYDGDRSGSGFWHNANMTPDFPSAARALESSYEAAMGRDLAGVITADPFALASLVGATEPAHVPGVDVTLEADDIVPFLSNEGYGVIEDHTERKRVLGRVSEVVVERALQVADPSVVLALLRTAGDGHINVYSDDDALEAGLRMTGAGGAFDVGDGDFLAVVQNNASADKLDYYTSRSVDYDVWLESGGGAHAVVNIALHNGTPKADLPDRVLGEERSDRDLPRGTLRTLLNVYCHGCLLERATSGGALVSLSGGDELGATFFQRDTTIPLGATSSLQLSWVTPNVWTGDGSSGSYTLTVHTQTTIEPTDLRIAIHLPEGTHGADLSDGMREQDGTVVWEGSAPTRLALHVAFEAPFPLGLWRDVTSWFG